MKERIIGYSSIDFPIGQQLIVWLKGDDEDRYEIWFEDHCCIGAGACLQSATSNAIRNLAGLLKELTTITVNHGQ